MTVIKVENLGKKYLIGHDRKAGGAFRYNSMRDSIAHSMRGVYQRLRHPLSPNRENTELEEFWALKDINFEIKQGDRVGIIGHNGAGKTTLLKLLSRITEPTTGSIKIKGRVASLLEVGTGFHPELTGRENIYLNGAILGMKRIEIKKKFDEIVAFAEVEKFLDTPVKRYSSGMYVRLAFAVAAHLEPEILIVDEVLAVGDAAFQKKSLGKMEDVSKEGRTVIFVSHNMSAVENLCNDCLLINKGHIKSFDSADKVITTYLSLHEKCNSVHEPPEKNGIKINLSLKSENATTEHMFPYDNIEFDIKIFSKIVRKNFNIGIGVFNNRGNRITTLHTTYQYNKQINVKGDCKIKVVWKNNFLSPGIYGLELSLFDENSNFAHWSNIGSFTVVETDYYKTGRLPDTKYQGDTLPEVKWEIIN